MGATVHSQAGVHLFVLPGHTMQVSTHANNSVSHLTTDSCLLFDIIRRAAVNVSLDDYGVIGRQIIALDRWELSAAKMLLEDAGRRGNSLLFEWTSIASVRILPIFR